MLIFVLRGAGLALGLTIARKAGVGAGNIDQE
jgi:hypothetical protein